MPQTWVDAQLGEFVLGDYPWWEGNVVAPAFDVFIYDWGKKPTNPNYNQPNGRYEVIIKDKNGTTDRPAAAALIFKLLSNQAALVGLIMNAMWDDVNGRGPDSGMWWHGDWMAKEDTTELHGSFIVDGLANEGLSLNCVEDLPTLMRLCRIVARDDVRNYDGLLVELQFDAAFEMEHGVGILTDGDRIVGTGYQVDVDLFKS